MKQSHSRTLLLSLSGLLTTLLVILIPVQSAYAATLPGREMLQVNNVRLTTSRFALNEAVKVDAAQPACLNQTTLPICYSPQQIRRAYGIQPLLDAKISGKRRTIAIIDDYQSPTLRSDLKTFDRLFGLPDPTLNIIAPFGLKPFDPKSGAAVGFAGEISLDVEWSHAIAPDATIDLVLGNPANDSIQGQINGLLKVTQYAAAHGLGDVMSLSVGAGETCYSSQQLVGFHRAFEQARANRTSVFVSSGDSGAAVARCDSKGNPVQITQGANYPASDPLVTGVGGTTLAADTSGNYIGEITWNDSAILAGATGGGFSSVFKRPSYQNQVDKANTRAVPDVAYNADSLTGVLTVLTLNGTTELVPAGGTSAGAPQWAGLTALIDQAAGKRLGFLNGGIYRLGESGQYASSFRDIQFGNNTYVYLNGNGSVGVVQGYNASKGWDPVTGFGTPLGATLATSLPRFVRAGDGAGL